jgi:DNA polymerase-3 subunit epsilon
MGHQLERVGSRGYRCALCTWTWTRPPQSLCPGVPRFGWWPDIPEHLRTQTQLRQMGLKPGGPVRGCTSGHDQWIWLYDAREAVPRRQVTEAQRAVLARGRQTQAQKRVAREQAELATLVAEIEAEDAERLADRDEAIAWACGLLVQTEPQVVALDCETTGLEADAEIISVAVVDLAGGILLNTLVKPEGAIPAEASAVHGLTDKLVATAPLLPGVWPHLQQALGGRVVVAYNAGFDRGMLRAGRKRHMLPRLGVKHWEDAMEMWNMFVGEEDAEGGYRWQPLPGGDHTALGDARAVVALLRRMAKATTAKENERERDGGV